MYGYQRLKFVQYIYCNTPNFLREVKKTLPVLQLANIYGCYRTEQEQLGCRTRTARLHTVEWQAGTTTWFLGSQLLQIVLKFQHRLGGGGGYTAPKQYFGKLALAQYHQMYPNERESLNFHHSSRANSLWFCSMTYNL